jgi:hypothetical protein
MVNATVNELIAYGQVRNVCIGSLADIHQSMSVLALKADMFSAENDVGCVP